MTDLLLFVLMAVLLTVVLYTTRRIGRRRVARTRPDPWLPIYHVLLVTHNGGTPTEAEENAAFDAAVSMAGATLVRQGVSLDAVETLFSARDFDVKLGYDNGELSVTIDWKDAGTQDTIRVAAAGVVPNCDDGGCDEPASTVCPQCTALLCPVHGREGERCSGCGVQLTDQESA